MIGKFEENTRRDADMVDRRAAGLTARLTPMGA
jgi:hypothetical protein